MCSFTINSTDNGVPFLIYSIIRCWRRRLRNPKFTLSPVRTTLCIWYVILVFLISLFLLIIFEKSRYAESFFRYVITVDPKYLTEVLTVTCLIGRVVIFHRTPHEFLLHAYTIRVSDRFMMDTYKVIIGFILSVTLGDDQTQCLM